MRLRDFARLNLETIDTRLICKEVEIGDMTCLLVGFHTYDRLDDVYCEDDTEDTVEETRISLYIMYEGEPECDEFADDFDLDDLYDNRRILMDSINVHPEPEAVNIERIMAGDKVILSDEMRNDCIDCADFRAKTLLIDAMQRNLIPESWLNIDSERVWIAEYIIECECNLDGISMDSEKWSFEIAESMTTHLINETFELEIGSNEINTFSFDIEGESIEVMMRSPEIIELPGKSILAIAYKTREDVQLDFYSKKHLDETIENGSCGIGLIMGTDDGWRYSAIESDSNVMCGKIEVELFCAHMQV